MRASLRTFRRLYGSNPLHLLALLGSFALIGYVVDKARLGALPERMAVWFVASFLIHDLVLFPLYALADRSLMALTSRRPRRRAMTSPADPAAVTGRAAAVNAIRVPGFLSLLLLVIFQGPIRHQGDTYYRAASGLHETNYLARWLLTTAVLFLCSAAFWAFRRGRRVPVDTP